MGAFFCKPCPYKLLSFRIWAILSPNDIVFEAKKDCRACISVMDWAIYFRTNISPNLKYYLLLHVFNGIDARHGNDYIRNGHKQPTKYNGSHQHV